MPVLEHMPRGVIGLLFVSQDSRPVRCTTDPGVRSEQRQCLKELRLKARLRKVVHDLGEKFWIIPALLVCGGILQQ